MKLNILIILVFAGNSLLAQKYISKNGEISFFSDAPLEDIEAVNDEVSSIFNSDNGEIAFTVPNRGFEFDKSLMQQHFNEKFMESHKYPESTFSGTIKGYDKNLFGTQSVTAEGNLSIHGVTRSVTIDGELKFDDNNVSMEAKFPVKVADYKIKIPKVVFYNIAEVVEVSVDINYDLYEAQ